MTYNLLIFFITPKSQCECKFKALQDKYTDIHST